MESYHLAWLAAHPDRTEAWLAERLADGFHVHHVDGDHSNDAPLNLVLMEGSDHMRMHAGSLKAGIASWRVRPKKPKAPPPPVKHVFPTKTHNYENKLFDYRRITLVETSA